MSSVQQCVSFGELLLRVVLVWMKIAVICIYHWTEAIVNNIIESIFVFQCQFFNALPFSHTLIPFRGLTVELSKCLIVRSSLIFYSSRIRSSNKVKYFFQNKPKKLDQNGLSHPVSLIRDVVAWSVYAPWILFHAYLLFGQTQCSAPNLHVIFDCMVHSFCKALSEVLSRLLMRIFTRVVYNIIFAVSCP